MMFTVASTVSLAQSTMFKVQFIMFVELSIKSVVFFVFIVVAIRFK